MGCQASQQDKTNDQTVISNDNSTTGQTKIGHDLTDKQSVQTNMSKPKLPKFIPVIDPKIQEEQNQQDCHDQIFDEPQENEIKVVLPPAKSPVKQPQSPIKKSDLDDLHNLKELTSTPAMEKKHDITSTVNDSMEDSHRVKKVKKVKRVKKVKEYEFNDNIEAEYVAQKPKNIMDQVELELNADIKKTALKRCGSAGREQKAIRMDM
ncbi:Conserved_hypothetical protein [Hexamita inflata]|uniref:Uncharacterized protein n=1 Tax=Hexamita inflata TaxID=28002 RepID=A0AA86TID0_9EUKA|nr:Conserved hypothetical protein [Hexamita inflata]